MSEPQGHQDPPLEREGHAGQREHRVVEGEDAQEAARVETASREAHSLRAGFDRAPAGEQDAGDQEPGEDEEQVDSGAAPVEPGVEALGHPVVPAHRQHGQRAQPVELGHVTRGFGGLGEGGGDHARELGPSDRRPANAN
jgi:hypothetical protein